MATWDDVRRIASALPKVGEGTSYGNPAWRVGDKVFAWVRPLRGPDREALGDAAPDGEILGVHVEHLGAKEALLADASGVFFTTPHFDGHASVLVRLDDIAVDELREVLVDAWLARAPPRVAEAYLAETGGERA